MSNMSKTVTEKRWNVVTARALIRVAAERWREQYGPPRLENPALKYGLQRIGKTLPQWDERSGPFGDGKLPEEVYRALAALDPDTATADDVSAIIGNDSWSHFLCDGCREYVEAAVEFDAGDGSTHLCLRCLRSAARDLTRATA